MTVTMHEGPVVDDLPDLFAVEAPDWGGAICAEVGPEPWFVYWKDSLHHQAKALCGSCPVREACLEYAMESEAAQLDPQYRYGVYGGLSADERKKLAAARALKEVAA